MVRHYQKKRPVKYSSEQLLAAVDAVKIRGMKRFGIPFSTLYDHAKGKVSNVGAGSPTVLSVIEEKEIVITLQVLKRLDLGSQKS